MPPPRKNKIISPFQVVPILVNRMVRCPYLPPPPPPPPQFGFFFLCFFFFFFFFSLRACGHRFSLSVIYVSFLLFSQLVIVEATPPPLLTHPPPRSVTSPFFFFLDRKPVSLSAFHQLYMVSSYISPMSPAVLAPLLKTQLFCSPPLTLIPLEKRPPSCYFRFLDPSHNPWDFP